MAGITLSPDQELDNVETPSYPYTVIYDDFDRVAVTSAEDAVFLECYEYETDAPYDWIADAQYLEEARNLDDLDAIYDEMQLEDVNWIPLEEPLKKIRLHGSAEPALMESVCS